MSKLQLLESLKKAGFKQKIISAFSCVDRENFIPAQMNNLAYEDIALPIGNNQTISQPYTIAVMLQMLDLKQNQNVLEIGSGSGYVLALMSKIVGERGRVFGIEIIRNLYERSKKALKSFSNVKIYNQDGYEGLPDKSPSQRIIISAALQKIPEKILSQLDEEGIVVAPLGSQSQQTITAIKKSGKVFFKLKEISGFVFVKFV